MRKSKWALLNGLAESPEPEVQLLKPTWEECRTAIKRAMLADNLRPTSIEDSLRNFEAIQRMFPEASSPADITSDMANEFKRRRAEAGKSPWTIRGDLATLRASFGKWLGQECGLLQVNPFANARPPRCDDPEIRIVLAPETTLLFNWLVERWNGWRLPLVYLQIAALVGWRATEIAGIREADVLADGHVKVAAAASKTRKTKYGWLPAELRQELLDCAADGWAFGRFSDDLRRLLLLWWRRPHQAARVKPFSPDRLVGWLQDELERFNTAQAKASQEAGGAVVWSRFTLHDFRRTAITGLQMAGVSEKDVSVMVGATPEVIRKHYERMDQMAIARRSVQKRLGAAGMEPPTIQLPGSLRAGCARPIDKSGPMTQLGTA